MTNVLVIAGSNHGFAESAHVIGDFLAREPEMTVTVTDDKGFLASSALADMDVCVFGSGFTRAVRQEDGSLRREAELAHEQEEGLLRFVAEGKGLVGIHGTGWWIGGRAVDLIGGHANWHPPGLTFQVQIDDPDHPVTREVTDFELDDEIYISAYDPAIHILASAEWHGRAHPVAWTKPFGQGRVFYTTLGHGAATFAVPMMQRMVTQGVRWAAGGH